MIINISNHKLNENQTSSQEVVELPQELKARWGQITPEEVIDLCEDILSWVQDLTRYEDEKTYIHIAGHASAVHYIVDNIKYGSVTARDRSSQFNGVVMYAHSVRESVESVQEDGSVVKRNVFNFQGWYNYHTNQKVVF